MRIVFVPSVGELKSLGEEFVGVHPELMGVHDCDHHRFVEGRIERTIPFLFGMETADVGMDLYTSVTSDYAKSNNKFTGTIDRLTVDLKKMNSADEDAAKKAAEISDEDDADDD